MNKPILDKVYKQQEEIVTRDIAGDTILVPIKGKLANMEKIFSFEGTANRIWDLLNGKNSVNDICKNISLAFDVETDKAKVDTLEFIDELLKTELIVEVQ